MISFLKGTIAEKKPPQLIIEVNGIGYVLTASMHTFYELPAEGKPISIFTELVVREDAQSLYGFSRQQERQLFTTLIKVSGVGPKMAISILSSITANDFVTCIHNSDTATLVRLPGIGKKTAERLVLDMRDRLNDWQTGEQKVNVGDIITAVSVSSAQRDAISALIALGYKSQEAKRAIDNITGENLSSEELIRQGLKRLVK